MRVQRESFIYQFVMPSQKVAEVNQKIGFYYYLTQKNQKIYFKRKQIQNYQGIDAQVIQKSISSTIQKYNQQLEMSKEGISKYIQRYSSIIVSYPFACFIHQPYQEILINFIKKQLSISAKISLMVEIAKGVDDLHSKEIQIRALKPSSIFIIDSKNEHFQISFAQLTDIYQNMSLTNDDKIRKMKMDPYTPPQLLKSQDYSTLSDIWSLGLIFYQIWFGKKLFKSHHQLDLSNIFPQNAPSWIINFLSKMICVNPKHRYNIKDIQRLLKNAKLCYGVLSKSL